MPAPRSSRTCAARSPSPSPRSSPTSPAWSTSTAGRTRRRASTRWAAGRRPPAGPGLRGRVADPNRPRARRDGGRDARGRRPGRRRAPVIGHMDTVFDPGTAAERPFTIAGRRRPRPGRHRHEERAAGRACTRSPRCAACRAACRSRASSFVANPDEEIGSPASTPHIRAARRRRRRVPRARVRPRQRRHRLVAQGHRRRRDQIHGRAAHAGVEPEKGRSAILEAARITTRPARAQRALAGRDRERRRDRRRDAAQRRRRAVPDGGRRPGGRPRRDGGGRGRDPRGWSPRPWSRT